MNCITGFLTLRLCVSVCPLAKYLKKIEPIYFIFGGSLPSDTGRKPLEFEKKKKTPPGKGGCASKFLPNIQRLEKILAITPKWWEFRHVVTNSTLIGSHIW